MPVPTVTLIVPTYQFARYVERAVVSALAQDLPAGAVQVVVVDDGSTDDTQAVLAPYRDRVEIVCQPNGGLLRALEAGLARARGRYLAILSGDDMLPPDGLRRRAEHLDRHPEHGLVYGDMEVVGDDDEPLQPSFLAATRLGVCGGAILPRLLHGNVVSGGGLMVRADLASRFAPFPAHTGWEDWWIAVRVAEVAPIGLLGGPPVYRYRRHAANQNLGARDLARLAREAVPFLR